MTGSGGRYEDWTHVTVVGNPAAAAPYLAEGRKMLGYVWDEAKRNNLGVHQLTRTMADGTIIVAEKHGSIPRITIMPVEGGGDERKNRIRGFVCKPTSATFPNGFNPDKPEAAIVSSGESEWATLYFDRRDPPWEDVPGPKSTYPRIGGQPAFPEGLTKYGNVDWIGKKEERVSWIGSDLRYFPTGILIGSTQVFRGGKVLFDTTDSSYPGDVRGACIRGMNLLVVTATLSAYDMNGSSTYTLMRVGLLPAPPSDGLPNLIANPSDIEMLWQGVHGLDPSSFFFNQSGTVACYCGGKSAEHRDRELVTLSINEAAGVWTASSTAQSVGGVVKTEAFGTTYPMEGGTTTAHSGTVTGEEYEPFISAGGSFSALTGDVGVEILVARDFKGDEPVDITIKTTGRNGNFWGAANNFAATHHWNSGGPQSLDRGRASGSVDEVRCSQRCTLRMGTTTLELWNIVYSVYTGGTSFVSAGSPNPIPSIGYEPISDGELSAKAELLMLQSYAQLPPRTDNEMTMAILVGIDARYESIVYYDVIYPRPAITPSPGINHPDVISRDFSADLVWQRGEIKTVMIPYAMTLPSGRSWLRDESDFAYYGSGIDFVQHHRFPIAVEPAGEDFNIRSITSYVPDIHHWLRPDYVDWSGGFGDGGFGQIATSFSVLTGDEVMYAGLNPAVAGEAVAWASKFDPWARTAITGANKKLHPTWVLPTTNIEIRTATP